MYEMGRDIHTRVLHSEKGCRVRVTHVHACSDCVHTRNDTVRLNYASRFVRVICSSHIVSIKLGTVTPPSLWTGSTRTIGRSKFSVALHTRPDGAACTFPGGAARVSPGSALFSAKSSPTLSTSTWISFRSVPRSVRFWRCNPHAPRRCHQHAPSFPCSSLCISGSASRTCSDGVSHTRPDVASPASVTVHSIASIVEPSLGPTLALLRSFSQAEFTSPSPAWRLTEDRSCSTSFLHYSPFSVSRRHPTNMLPRCYPNISDLSR